MLLKDEIDSQGRAVEGARGDYHLHIAATAKCRILASPIPPGATNLARFVSN